MMEVLGDMKTLEIRSEIPLFLERNRLNGLIVEVGVRFGFNFEQLLSCNPRLAVGVDHWRDTGDPAEQDTNIQQSKLDELYLQMQQRVWDRKNAKIIRASSRQASTLFLDSSLDFVYVDANHTRKGCLEDMEIWWKKVRQGGVLAGHDYVDIKAKNGVPFGVIKAVQDFLTKRKIDKDLLHVTKQGFKTWMIYKVNGE